MPTPEELMNWRSQAAAAGDTSSVAQIDAELAKSRPKEAAPLGDFSPLQEAYADKQKALAGGAPPDVIAAIDAHINDFTRKMQEADVGRTLESMGPAGRFLAGAGHGLVNVGRHVQEAAQEIFPFKNRDENLANLVARRKTEDQVSEPLTQTLTGEAGNIVGEAAGTAPLAMAVPAAAGPVLGSAMAGGATGALLSEPGERSKSAALMALAGAGTGVLSKAMGAAGRGIVKPTKEAQTLQDLGVEGITAGQANPHGVVAHFEQAAESTPMGAPVKAAREVLPKNLEHRIIQEAYPPGFESALPKEASTADKLAELKHAFGERYGALYDKNPVPKNAIQHDVLGRAMNPTGRVVAPSDRAAAENFVADELAKLDQHNSLETLANIRSNVSERVRSLQRSNPELAGHLKDVKSALTGHIQDALKASADPEAFSKLKALDQAYSKFMTVSGAAGRDLAGPATITPDSLSRSILRRSTPAQFAAGGGGTLRELATAGKQVLNPPRPTTGALMGLLEAVPFAGKWGAGTAGYISSHFPRAMMGQTLPQRVLMKTLGNPVVSGAMGQAARTGLSDFLLPFGTEEDAPEPDVPFSPKVLAKSLKGR